MEERGIVQRVSVRNLFCWVGVGRIIGVMLGGGVR